MLLEDAEQGVVSPEGARIAFFRVHGFAQELWLADADGRNPRRMSAQQTEPYAIRTDTWSATWSPDGQRIAYIHRETIPSNYPGGDRFFVYTQKADGSDARLVVQDDRFDYVVAQNGDLRPPPLLWAPDGRLYFALRSQAQPGSPDHDVCSISVDQATGKPLRQPRKLLGGGLGWIGGFSASRTGRRLLFWRSDVTEQVFLSELSGSTGMMAPPHRLTLDQSVASIPVDWTADSKGVVLASVRNGKHGVYKQRIDETISEALLDFRKAQPIVPRLSGDGQEILYAETDKPTDPNAPVSLLAVPIAGGTPRVILSEPGVNNVLCAKPPSQVCILNEIVMGDSLYYLLDLKHGKGRLVAKLPKYANWGLSPDGSILALVAVGDGETIRFVSVDSGTIRDVLVKDWPIGRSADWSADSKAVLIASVDNKGVPVVLGIDTEGSVKVLLQSDRREQRLDGGELLNWSHKPVLKGTASAMPLRIHK